MTWVPICRILVAMDFRDPQAFKTPLPKAAEQAIVAGKPWQGVVKAATLELTRDDWPTGKGYELHFLVRPNQ